MDTFERLLEATAADYEHHVLRNPLLELVATGQARVDQYIVYLRETYHLVRHTSRALARAASRVDDAERGLRAWLLEQANEEHGHELFCLKDLQNLGLDPAAITASTPGAGAWGAVTQNYYFASEGHPVALLGVASATEGMGADLAGNLAAVLVERYGVPHTAATFLRVHGALDQRHCEQARDAVNNFVRPDDLPWVVHGRRMTFLYYGQLMREVAACAERFSHSVAQPESTHA
jgi:pyrroloquinoline quinone (PQQ) biosynthesis protein C